MIKDLIEIGEFSMPPTAKIDRVLSKLLRNIINTYDFIDFGVLIANTEVYFDNKDLNVIIVSTPYFEYVARGGIELLDLFMTDGIFLTYVQEKYNEMAQEFTNMIGTGQDLLSFKFPLPKVTIMTEITNEGVKALRRKVEGGGRHSGRKS
jgi:hypothetical protein